MKKSIGLFLTLLCLAFSLSGCGHIGEKNAGVWVVYAATAVIALIVLLVYCFAVGKKDLRYFLLFASVAVVNIGYFTLAVSSSLEEALLANRIAYLGSVFLPIAMLMIILKTAKIGYAKWLPVLLVGIGMVVFAIAASPGYSDIYYKEVYFEVVNGVAMLNKVYGPWHILYLFYLLGYFGVMIGVIVYAAVKRKTDATVHIVLLAMAVSVNIGVWLIEQLVKIEIEILSVSYIICEIFLLGLNFAMQENKKLKELISQQDVSRKQAAAEENSKDIVQVSTAVTQQFLTGVDGLTKTERAIYECYLSGKSTKEILVELNIKENTLKFHNKNIYGKLGVSSRKQLVEIARQLDGKQM